MPIYEGITLIQEKQAVVLDLGWDYTKFGFAGEAGPRCVVKSEWWCPRERCMRPLHVYESTEQLYENLVHILHQLYFRHVLVNPKERKVMVVESLLTPTLFRETLARVLYTHLEVSGVVWGDSSQLSCLTLGVRTALVVSLGSREAEVTAVIENVPVTHSLHTQPIGANAIHKQLATFLEEDNGTELHLPEHILEDIKVRTCFVSRRERSLVWSAFEVGKSERPKEAPSVRYPLARLESGCGGAGSTIIVSGRTRERTAEVLFHRNGECNSLADLILQCIIQCPVDSRRPLAENILVTGGTASLLGLRSRLGDELRHLSSVPPYSERVRGTFKFHSPPSHQNYTAWLGGAILGATEAMHTRATTREQYSREGRVRDWVNLLDNTPTCMQHYHQL